MKLNLVALVTGLLTAVHPDWLELIGLSPDHGNGSAEILITGSAGAIAMIAGIRVVQRLRTT